MTQEGATKQQISLKPLDWRRQLKGRMKECWLSSIQILQELYLRKETKNFVVDFKMKSMTHHRAIQKSKRMTLGGNLGRRVTMKVILKMTEMRMRMMSLEYHPQTAKSTKMKTRTRTKKRVSKKTKLTSISSLQFSESKAGQAVML